jgi:AraC-like DNA-binding protein
VLLQAWSTEALPARDQYSFVRETMQVSPFPCTIERPGFQSTDAFPAKVTLEGFGALVRLSAQSAAAMGVRGSREIAQTSDDFVWIDVSRNPCWVQGRQAEFAFGAGEILIGDSSTAATVIDEAGSDYTMWVLPRAMIAPLLGRSTSGELIRVRPEHPFGSLLSSYLAHLGPALEQADASEQDALVDILARLVAMQQGIKPEAAEVAGEALRAAKLAQAKRLIGTHLADPLLSPEWAAARLGVSVRQLHRLFEPTGTSFSRYVRGERLARCHEMLANPAFNGRSVTDIAFGWGFDSLATFYRAFNAAYGLAPLDVRRT